MIILNFTKKSSTKAIFTHLIQIKLQEGPCIKSYLHNQPYIFKIRPLFKQIKHMMHKINAALLCRHLGCHTTHSIKFVIFQILHTTCSSFFTESFSTRSGAVSRPSSQPPLGVRPVGQEQPGPVFMNTAKFVLELLCVTLTHRTH